jgi:hypothetical protein
MLVLSIFPITSLADIDESMVVTLTDAANDICQSSSIEGHSTSVKAEGKISAEVNKILKSLVAVGGGLKGNVNEKKWNGVPQEDLVLAIKDSNNCKLKVLQMLLSKVEVSSNEAPKKERISSKYIPIDWNDNVARLRGRLEQDFSFKCAPNGRASSVWGTDVYTDDSKVCSAGVHAGLITVKDGGVVTLRIKPGEEYYIGSKRNGISSQKYGQFSSSYTFIE